MRNSVLIGAAAMLALSGCQGEPVANNTVSEPENVAVAPPPAANVVVAKPDAAPALNLAPDELTLVLDTGATRHITFGMEKVAATQMVAAALGSPIEQATNEECGAGPLQYAVFRDGLSLYFQDGKFAGWDLDGRENGKFSTGNGIGIGTTRKALEDAAGPVAVEESSIGQEFTVGEMSGLLSANEPGGKVTNLWAGVTCIAR